LPALALVLAVCTGCGLQRGSLVKGSGKTIEKLPIVPEETPSELSAQQKDTISLALGRSLERRGETQQARQVYHQLLAKDENSVPVLHRLAVIHAKEGNAAKAEALYQ